MFVELTQGTYPTPARSIADNIAAQPLVDAENVVAYLRMGHHLIYMMDSQDDVLDPVARRLINGSSIQTDGDWLWRQDYAYYVRRHNVIVPDDFLTTIRERNYVVPLVLEEVLVSLTPQAEELAFGRRISQ
jgi:hypothetical protein